MDRVYKNFGIWLFLWVCSWSLSPSVVYGQDLNFEYINYSVEDGLSHNTATNIYMDTRGFIWISTIEGLNRFDGKTFKVFRHNPSDSTTISGNFIHGVYEDSKGTIWVNTRNSGLNRFDPATEKFKRYTHREGLENSIPLSPVLTLYEDTKGVFWIGFQDESFGLFDEKNGSYTPSIIFDPIKKQVLSIPKTVTEMNNGDLIITSHDGAYILPAEELNNFRERGSRGDTLEAISFNASLSTSKDHISHFIDTDGELWAEEFEQGMMYVDRKKLSTRIQESLDSGVLRNGIKGDYIQRGNLLLTASRSHGVMAIDKTTLKTRSIHPLNNTDIPTSKIYEDKFGGLWICTWGWGIYRIKERATFNLFNKALYKGLPADFTLAFEDENEQSFWVGTSEGSGIMNTKTNTFKKITNESTWAIAKGKNGVWVGTRNKGLKYVASPARSNKVRTFDTENSFLKMNDVHQVFIDSRNWLWLGYEGEGVQVISNVDAWIQGAPASIIEFSSETLERRLSSNSIRRIYEDLNGDIWLATNNGGANRIAIQGGEFSSINHFSIDTEITIGHNAIRSILQQNETTFWFGTDGRGLTKWDESTDEVSHFSTDSGLPNTTIYGVLPDKNPNYIWVSTNNGISRMNTQREVFQNFSISEGLQNQEFNTGAFLRRDNGDLLFGGIKGFNLIDPEAIELNDRVPEVFITESLLFNEPLASDSSALLNKRLTLPHNENFLSFEFAAINYDEPDKNQYAYKMDGIDEDWVYSDNRNFAGYPNLEPGEYTFNVKASNNNGVWNEAGTYLNITITPPWWATWWFRTLGGSALLFVFGYSIRFISQRKLREQIRKMEIEHKLKEERTRISRDLHDHVGAQLTNITSGLSLIDKYSEHEQQGKAQELAKSLQGDAKNTISQLRETIWALNQKELDLAGFEAFIKDYFKKQSALEEVMNIEYDFDTSSSVILSPTQALNLFRVIQEATQNSVKYSGANQLVIKVCQQNGSIITRIKDDGTFKEKEENRTSYGLGNMEKRAQELGGTLEMDTSSGTEVIVHIPINT